MPIAGCLSGKHALLSTCVCTRPTEYLPLILSDLARTGLDRARLSFVFRKSAQRHVVSTLSESTASS